MVIGGYGILIIVRDGWSWLVMVHPREQRSKKVHRSCEMTMVNDAYSMTNHPFNNSVNQMMEE